MSSHPFCLGSIPPRAPRPGPARGRVCTCTCAYLYPTFSLIGSKSLVILNTRDYGHC